MLNNLDLFHLQQKQLLLQRVLKEYYEAALFKQLSSYLQYHSFVSSLQLAIPQEVKGKHLFNFGKSFDNLNDFKPSPQAQGSTNVVEPSGILTNSKKLNETVSDISLKPFSNTSVSPLICQGNNILNSFFFLHK
jgi:hypothetical protein